MTHREAENDVLKKMLERHDERERTGDTSVAVIVPAGNIEEIIQRVERACELSSNAPLRVGEKFLRETDRKLN